MKIAVLAKSFRNITISSIVFLCLLVAIYDFYVDRMLKKEVKQLRTPQMKVFTMEYESNRNAPAFLLIHGFASFPYDMEPVAHLLKKKGFAYKAILLPGHGKDPRILSKTKYREWIAKVLEEYDELKLRHESVSVVGFSLGGSLALYLAENRKVENLILIAPYFKVKQQWFYFGTAEGWAKRLSPILPFVRKIKLGMINDPDGLKNYHAFWHVPLKAVEQVAKLGSMVSTQASKVRSDVLWVHSRADIVADYEMSQKVYSSLTANRKRFVSLNKSNHIILYDYDRDAVLKEIGFFLDNRYRNKFLKNTQKIKIRQGSPNSALPLNGGI